MGPSKGSLTKLKRVDLVEFANADLLFSQRKITKGEFAKRCGLSRSTLYKYYPDLVVMLQEKIISGEFKYNIDGKQFSLEEARRYLNGK